MFLFIVILFVAGGVAFVAYLKPDEFRVSRSAVVNAPPAVVFDQVNDLPKWQAWSPWVKMDPQAKTTYAGPQAGTGAQTSWEGKKTGQGTMTIVESTPSSALRFKLEFLKPMKAVNTVEFIFAPEASGTHVTWTMIGKNSFAGKLMGIFMNCEKMIGDQFASGLANLKAVVEKK